MKMIFLSNFWNFYVDSENAIKFREKFVAFGDNLVWSSAVNFRQLWQECMWAAVNLLKSGPKISDHTKGHHKQLNLFDINIELA